MLRWCLSSSASEHIRECLRLLNGKTDIFAEKFFTRFHELGGPEDVCVGLPLKQQENMLVWAVQCLLDRDLLSQSVRADLNSHQRYSRDSTILSVLCNALEDALQALQCGWFTAAMSAAWREASGSLLDVLLAGLYANSRGSIGMLADGSADADTNACAAPDQEGTVYVSLYPTDAVPLAANGLKHEREMFRKRHLVLRGTRLLVHTKRSVPASMEFDLREVDVVDTSSKTTPAAQLHRSFGVVARGAGITYFLCTGDAEQERWYVALLQIRRMWVSFRAQREGLPAQEPRAIADYTVDDFDHGAIIGQGSFGAVYRIRDRWSGRVYASKVVQKATATAAVGQIARLHFEHELLQQFSHPFIVRTHTAFESAEAHFMVMDFHAGGDLAFHLRQGPFDEHRALFYVAEIASAISYLHDNSIVHCDVKLANILLDMDGHAVLADFGLAMHLKNGRAQRGPHSGGGTLAYAAPETLQTIPTMCGAATDWWALGVVLVNMLTGEHPFVQSNAQKTANAILKSQLLLPDTLTGATAELCRRLLTKCPSRRMTSLTELAEHCAYDGFSFAACVRRELPPPYVPDASGSSTKYFAPVADPPAQPV